MDHSEEERSESPSRKEKIKGKWKKLKESSKEKWKKDSTEEPQEITPLQPENTIIAFDLHHVLARPKTKLMAKTIKNHPDKKQLIKALQASGFVKQLILARIAGKDDTVPEKKMKDLTLNCEKDKDKDRYSVLNPLVTELCNCQEPDYPTFELISILIFFNFLIIFSYLIDLGKLKANGYSIYLLSNIGSDYFTQLQNMWPPNIFNDFDGFYTTNPDHGYVKKPSPEIFDLFVFDYNFE